MRSRTDYTYDAYGNVTQEVHYGDTATTTDDRTVVRTYAANTTEWIVSLPTQERLHAGSSARGTKLAQTDFYYDGTTSCTVASTNQQPTHGKLTRTVRWLSGATSHPETRMAYDAKGNVLCTRDALGQTTTTAYDPSGTFVTTVTNPKGQVTTTAYYGVNGVATDHGLYGQVKRVTDSNGAVATTQYDALGRRTRVTQPDGFWTTTSYVNVGTVGSQHVRTDSQLGLSTWTYFDGLGRATKTLSTGPENTTIVTRTEYDARGAVRRRSVPAFTTATTTQWTTFRYDALGRVTRTTYPDGTQTRACYDDWVTVEIDANRHKTRTTRDAYGRVVKVEEYTGTYTTCSTARGTPYATTTYVYDRLGNLLTVTDALGNRTTMRYDTLSRKTQMRDPDLGTWTYQYDLNGNLIRQTDAKRQRVHFHYDSLHRRVQKDYGTRKALGSGDVMYTYDGTTAHRQGRLAQVEDVSGTAQFQYDVAGRVTRTDKWVDSPVGAVVPAGYPTTTRTRGGTEVQATRYTTTSTYDGLGRVTSLTYPDTSTSPPPVTYTYTGPQLASVQAGTTTYARYSGFNALGQPSTLTLGNGTATTYTYDAQNYRLATLRTVQGSTVLQDLGYTFDAGGNVTGLTDTRHGNQTYTYDDLDRLTGATGGYGTVSYSYNQIGNMLSNSKVGTYRYNASGTTSTRPHAVTRAGTGADATTYSYDANGNVLVGGGRIITWDEENRPASMIKDGVTTRFVYNGDGGRVKKTVSRTQLDDLTGESTLQASTTVYVGQLLVCEGTACAKQIYAGSQRIALVQGSGSTSYFHGDHLGSTSVLTDGNGTAEEHNSYLPYGDIHTHTGTTDVAYKYTGQERDASTGVYFYNARYYDPVLGRFLSPDTYVQNPGDPQTLNRYAYARNNPVRYTDPSGHFFGSIFKFFKRIAHGVTKAVNRVFGKAAPFVTAAVAVVASVATFGAAAVVAKTAFFKAATAGLASQAAIGAKIVAVSSIANVVGSTAGGIAAGFVGGFVGSGGDLESGLIGAAGGGLGGLASGLGAVAGAKYGSAVRVVGRGVAGGTMSALRGGKFELGVAFSGGAALINSAYRGITKFPGINPGPGGAAQIKRVSGPAAIWGANNIGDSVYDASDRTLTSEGSRFSRMLNHIPYMNAMAGLHDSITSDQYLGKNFLSNVPTMAPAYALTVTGSIDQVWIGGANHSLSPLLF